LWISLLERRALLSGTIAATPDRTAFYLTSGMTF
jgi:hypothetical protein